MPGKGSLSLTISLVEINLKATVINEIVYMYTNFLQIAFVTYVELTVIALYHKNKNTQTFFFTYIVI